MSRPSTAPRTLITGCDLVIQEPEFPGCVSLKVHGDLWIVGQTYIFNACIDDQQHPLWNMNTEHDKQLIVDGTHDYFQRRGVFIIPCEIATLNPAAKEYISRAPF